MCFSTPSVPIPTTTWTGTDCETRKSVVLTTKQVTHSGTALDNDFWVSRKRAAVIRFNASTWRLQNQFGGDEEAFKAKSGLGETAKDYAIHGGGVPVFIKNCDGPVAVVVVSGLKQWDDHQVVIEELGKLCKQMERGNGEAPI